MIIMKRLLRLILSLLVIVILLSSCGEWVASNGSSIVITTSYPDYAYYYWPGSKRIYLYTRHSNEDRFYSDRVLILVKP